MAATQVTSSKTNLGHLEGGAGWSSPPHLASVSLPSFPSVFAGMAGFIKCILQADSLYNETSLEDVLWLEARRSCVVRRVQTSICVREIRIWMWKDLP